MALQAPIPKTANISDKGPFEPKHRSQGEPTSTQLSARELPGPVPGGGPGVGEEMTLTAPEDQGGQKVPSESSLSTNQGRSA